MRAFFLIASTPERGFAMQDVRTSDCQATRPPFNRRRQQSKCLREPPSISVEGQSPHRQQRHLLFDRHREKRSTPVCWTKGGAPRGRSPEESWLKNGHKPPLDYVS